MHNIAHQAEVKNNKDHWYYLKIIPYYNQHGQSANGVVITLTNINEIKQLQQQKDVIQKDLRSALKTGLIGIWHANLESHNFSYDDTIKKILGLPSRTSITKLNDFIAFIHPNDRKRIEKAFAMTIEKHADFEQIFRIVRADKSIRHLSFSANVHHDPELNLDAVTGICSDITEQYWLDEKIIDSMHLNLSLDEITDGWWDWDITKNKTYLSPLLKKTMGYDDHEIANRMESYEQMMFADDLSVLRNKMENYFSTNSNNTMVQKLRMKHKNGDTVWILCRRKGIRNKQGKLIRMIGTLTNITTMKETETILEQLAYRDLLTQIPNRAAFMDALLRAIERAKRKKSVFALMFLDIDDFKNINDQWGHNMGDAVLREFSQRIINCSRSIDYFARLGGDEFAILLEDITDLDEIRDVAARYVSGSAEILHVNGQAISISISLGVAIYPKHGTTDQAMLKHADKNMYSAKQHGKNQFILKP